MLKKVKTNSYFVTIYQNNKKKFIRRKKRKGLHAYPRTLSPRDIDKYLKETTVKYPKLLKNYFNYTDEEYIEPTKELKILSNEEIIDNVITIIEKLNKINIKNKKVTWTTNSEFLQYSINNLKKVIQSTKSNQLKIYFQELDKIPTDLDNNRKICFIHGDIHRGNMIINNKDLYLIDWELATFGDLAYELATHFILMDYSNKEKEKFLNKLNKKIKLNMENLKHDIDIYTIFEQYRRKVLKELRNNKIKKR